MADQGKQDTSKKICKAESSLSTEVANLEARNQELAKELESFVHSWVEAINTRQITLENPVYQSMDPDFSTIPGPPWPRVSENLTEHLARLNKICEMAPDYGLDVLSMDTSINRKKGTAEVHSFLEVRGRPGVTYQTVAIVAFREREDGWKCYTFKAIDGVDTES